MKRYAGKYPQLKEKEVKRLLRKTTRAVTQRPLDFQAVNKAKRNCQREGRRAFAEIAARDKSLKLEWTKYGLFLGRPEEIPHGKSYFQGLKRKSPELKELVEKLVEAIEDATALSYAV
jgi:hypothetical protein